MRLIDADKMREWWLENGENEFVYDTNAVLDSIDNEPTVEIQAVRHGRWEEIRNAYGELEGWLCECGREVKSKYNYCPNCGAKMDL